ncbi:hypothetical protein FJTKL_08462 [Diaporthe vaccinii]|uniref:Uncharacterized protein n=1 Tax=Diaporthe vaccinii TaxID=105482 RepID=A0ABR4ERE8_9PEZI
MIEGAVAWYEQAVLDIRSAPDPYFDEMSEDVFNICVKVGSPLMAFFGYNAELNEIKGIEFFDEIWATLQGAYSQLAGSCEHLLCLLSHASYEYMALSRQLRADGDIFGTAMRGLKILEGDLLAALQYG